MRIFGFFIIQLAKISYSKNKIEGSLRLKDTNLMFCISKSPPKLLFTERR
jgi:hypothetical protein